METKENNNTASTHQEKARKLKKLRRWQIVVSLLGIAILIWGIIQVVCLFLNYKRTETSNDAQIEQYISPVNLRASGYIKKICFTEHQEVHKGDTLLILDDREYKIRVMEAEAALKDAQAGATVIGATLQTTQTTASVYDASIAEIEIRLTKLEKEYEIISKKQPLFEKSSAKNVRYVIEDNFFTFWFRFIYKYSYMLEIENYGSVKMIIGRDYETFSGLMLERYFKRVLIERQVYTRIGGWWDRKGENEIDIVAENELDDTATFFEVKRKAENIDMEKLEAKAAAFMRATGEFKGYSLSYKGLSMTDM